MMMNEIEILRRGLTPSMHGRCVLTKISETVNGHEVKSI